MNTSDVQPAARYRGVHAGQIATSDTYRVRELLMRSPSIHPCTLLGTVCGALIVVGIVAAHPAHADFWVRPQVKEVFSQSRESFVRVIPGNSLEDGVGFSGSPRVR